jgi:hypothetical protein
MTDDKYLDAPLYSPSKEQVAAENIRRYTQDTTYINNDALAAAMVAGGGSLSLEQVQGILTAAAPHLARQNLTKTASAALDDDNLGLDEISRVKVSVWMLRKALEARGLRP